MNKINILLSVFTIISILSCKKDDDEPILLKSIIEIDANGEQFDLIQEQEWPEDKAYRRVNHRDEYAEISFMSTGQSTGNHSDFNISMTFEAGVGSMVINKNEAPAVLDTFDYDNSFAFNLAEDYYEIDAYYHGKRYQYRYSYLRYNHDTLYYSTNITKYGDHADDKVEGSFEALLIAEESLINPNDPPKFLKVTGKLNMYASGEDMSWDAK